jgi:cytoskeletal protein CcmA (bactofilin family)
MFGKTTSQPSGMGGSDRKEQSFLQRGVRFEGSIEADGDLRIEGSVKGTLNVHGLVIIGSEADAEGLLRGQEVVIHGKAEGTILAEQQIHMARGARVTAHVFCQSLVIEEGVFFHGRSHMGEAIPELSKVKELAKEQLPVGDRQAENAAQGTRVATTTTPATTANAATPTPRDKAGISRGASGGMVGGSREPAGVGQSDAGQRSPSVRPAPGTRPPSAGPDTASPGQRTGSQGQESRVRQPAGPTRQDGAR